jgi:hypothetical protein
MSNKLSFDYNNIRKLTSNLKTNLKDKYNSLENITSSINTTDGTGYQYSSLQVSESDKYIDELTLLFDTNTLDGNYKINGNLSVNTLQANNIILNNENDINTIIESIKKQDMKLSKQTINNSELNEITINNSRIYSSVISNSTFNNIRSINGPVNINGITKIGATSSSISHIEFGYVTLNGSGTYTVTTNPFNVNPTILLSYTDLGGAPTNILYTSGVSSPSFIINGDANKKVSWMLIE